MQQVIAAAAKCVQTLLDRAFCELRQVVMLTQMPENQPCCAALQERYRRFGAVRIGKMPDLRSDAHFEIAGVGACAEHFLVVIGFQQDEIAARQRGGNRLRYIAEIGADCAGSAVRQFHAVAAALRGVMGCRKGCDADAGAFDRAGEYAAFLL